MNIFFPPENSSNFLFWGKPSDLSQQVEEVFESLINLRNLKMHYQKYHEIQFCFQLYIDTWKIILYLQANPNRLKNKNINSLVYVNTTVK